MLEVINRKIVVPSLRFKGFDREWRSLTLGEVAEKIQDGTHFSPSQLEEGNYKYITSKNIRNGYMDLRDISFLSDEDHREIYRRCDVKFNDILLTKDGASTGSVCLNVLQEEFSLLSSVACIRANQSITTNDFLFQIIAGPKGQSAIKSSIAGQAITRITLTKIRNFRFSYPSLGEQEKIASFLSSVDEKIQQLKRKKNLLEQYKKGVMQQLFSGKVRFKDENGKEYPEWEPMFLGELLKIGSGRDYKHLAKGDIPVFGTGGYMCSVNEKLYSGETVFIGRKGTIDKPFYFNGEFWTVDTLFYTYNFKGVIPKFIYLVFQQINLKLYNEASGVPSLSKATIEKIKIKIPCLREQEMIAECIFSIALKTESISHQITQTQTFKRGLLQQMFV